MELDRNLYRRIKSLDRVELSRVLNNIYDQGKQDAGAVSMDENELKIRLSKINGIGENRLNAIMQVIDEYIDEIKNK